MELEGVGTLIGGNVSSHDDHRMAMSFAPGCIPFGEITIKNPLVVQKSYPNFWTDLRNAGFTIEEID